MVLAHGFIQCPKARLRNVCLLYIYIYIYKQTAVCLVQPNEGWNVPYVVWSLVAPNNVLFKFESMHTYMYEPHINEDVQGQGK